jgi:hypothetical protein
MGLGIHVQEEEEEVVEQNLPPAGQEAVGPLGGVMVVGRGGRYELVAKDGGRPLAAPRSYRSQGGVLRERQRSRRGLLQDGQVRRVPGWSVAAGWAKSMNDVSNLTTTTGSAVDTGTGLMLPTGSVVAAIRTPQRLMGGCNAILESRGVRVLGGGGERDSREKKRGSGFSRDVGVSVTGHSLGGALAVLIADELAGGGWTGVAEAGCAGKWTGAVGGREDEDQGRDDRGWKLQRASRTGKGWWARGRAMRGSWEGVRWWRERASDGGGAARHIGRSR